MGYTLLLSLIEYKTLVMRGDFGEANKILPQIPQVGASPAQAWWRSWLRVDLAPPCICFLRLILTSMKLAWYYHLPEDTIPDCVMLKTKEAVL